MGSKREALFFLSLLIIPESILLTKTKNRKVYKAIFTLLPLLEKGKNKKGSNKNLNTCKEDEIWL